MHCICILTADHLTSEQSKLHPSWAEDQDGQETARQQEGLEALTTIHDESDIEGSFSHMLQVYRDMMNVLHVSWESSPRLMSHPKVLVLLMQRSAPG